ncbi:hypothetical protein FACS189490_01420 [Clostridia bacterium]|nr:hypothetical protein FACS189490_01420 [Clostridia bacterium]
MRRKIIIIISLLLLCGCAAGNGKSEEPSPSEASLTEETTAPVGELKAENPASSVTPASKEEKIGDDLPVSRALAAKMLVLLLCDQIDLERQIPFSDCPDSAWFTKYVNTAYAYGIMNGVTESEFAPESPLTVQQAQTLIDRASKDAPKMQIGDSGNKPISYALWVSLFEQTAKLVSENIKADVIIPLAVPENNAVLTGYRMVTDKGPYTYDGLITANYVDRAIRVLKKDTEILAVTQVYSLSPVIENAFVIASDSARVTVFSGGAERTYKLADGVSPPIPHTIASVKIADGEAVSITPHAQYARGVIKRTDETAIELDSKAYETDKSFKIYSFIDGVAKWKNLVSLTVGTDIAEFYISEGVIKAAVITKTATPQNIRVSIQNSNYGGLYHESVSVTADANFSVICGEIEKYLAPGEAFAFTKEMFKNKERAYIESDGKISVVGLKRSSQTPYYRGTLEVSLASEGFLIVNEVNLEEYLYSVVPSETPTSFGIEAAKVQAVTARSYAYSQFYANRFHKYGGNVDDSTSCQVYNNIPENDTSIAAVDATKGKCLTYDGEVISATFFSTSAGITANSGEVWAGGGTLNNDTPAYLSSKIQNKSKETPDLSGEAAAREFFADINFDSYDAQFSWFRWNVTMTWEQITKSVNAMLPARFSASPKLIKTLTNGVFVSRPINSVGNVADIEVMSRGKGGNITSLKITGTEETILVFTEYNIRVMLSPSDSVSPIDLTRKDGSTVTNYALLPSAFMAFDKDGEGVYFFGGGNGHGVGMSQNGVKGMIDAGYAFDEILTHYYAGTEIKTKIFYQ